jgi:hypothetical protein
MAIVGKEEQEWARSWMLYLGSIIVDLVESGEGVEFRRFLDMGHGVVLATEIDDPVVAVEVDVATGELVTVGIQKVK